MSLHYECVCVWVCVDKGVYTTVYLACTWKAGDNSEVSSVLNTCYRNQTQSVNLASLSTNVLTQLVILTAPHWQLWTVVRLEGLRIFASVVLSHCSLSAVISLLLWTSVFNTGIETYSGKIHHSFFLTAPAVLLLTHIHWLLLLIPTSIHLCTSSFPTCLSLTSVLPPPPYQKCWWIFRLRSAPLVM